MVQVMDVARYIINYSNEQNYGISNLKLQKLLYFVQAYFLLYRGEICFDAAIEAWDFGPVVPEVYHEFKRFGNGDIPKIRTYLDMSSKVSFIAQRKYDEGVIPVRDRELIAEVVDIFSDYSATALVTLTHNQDPWIDAYRPGQNRRIEPEAIERYFDNE